MFLFVLFRGTDWIVEAWQDSQKMAPVLSHICKQNVVAIRDTVFTCKPASAGLRPYSISAIVDGTETVFHFDEQVTQTWLTPTHTERH